MSNDHDAYKDNETAPVNDYPREDGPETTPEHPEAIDDVDPDDLTGWECIASASAYNADEMVDKTWEWLQAEWPIIAADIADKAPEAGTVPEWMDEWANDLEATGMIRWVDGEPFGQPVAF